LKSNNIYISNICRCSTTCTLKNILTSRFLLCRSLICCDTQKKPNDIFGGHCDVRVNL